jgi:hypothetical protein
MNTAEMIYREAKDLTEPEAREVLDFMSFLKEKRERDRRARRKKALAVLDKYQGIYDGTPFDRDELHDRP